MDLHAGRRFPRLVAAGSLAAAAAAAAAAALIALGHRELPAARFEFGLVRSFRGLIVADPYPSLIVARGEGSSRHLLSGPGKSGAEALVESAVGRLAALRGTLAVRGGQTMIQVEPGSVVPLEAPGSRPPPLPETDLGERYVEGEIVGSKCYLGVMNPGSGIAHRACATVCILGGVAPLLEVRHEDGRREGFVLAGPKGEAVWTRLRGLVATPVGVTGRLVRRGGTTFLLADPAAIRRLQ
ncbi:MAG: hypothetical protein OXU64_11855 [Gemmatimonadota bacterium]|nr:hypothetical protein [Gemmatimonadota bacterium]